MQKSNIVASTYSQFKFIRSNKHSTFGVTTDGRLFAHGFNKCGELGLGQQSEINNFQHVKGFEGKAVKDVWVFQFVTFVSTEDGALYASGLNSNGELGFGDNETRYQFTPVLGFVDNPIVKIVGDNFFLWKTFIILDHSGKLYWIDQDQQRYIPIVEISEKIKWIKLGFGSVFLCTEQGHIMSWGINMSGCLGVGDTIPRNTFVLIPDLPTQYAIEQLEIDNTFLSAFALTREGFLFTWGNNNYKQLARGNEKKCYSPKMVKTTYRCDYKSIINGLYQIRRLGTTLVTGLFKSIKAYSGSVYAISNEGKLFVCGNNAKGQLGVGDTASRNIFVEAKGIDEPVVKVFVRNSLITVMTTQGDEYQCVGGSRQFTPIPKTSSKLKFDFAPLSICKDVEEAEENSPRQNI